MLIAKQIKVTALSIAIMITAIIALSSFITHDPPKAKASKLVVKKQHHILPASGPTVFHTYYWDGAGWVNDPVGDCLGNGEVCSVGFNNGDPACTVAGICNSAKAAYAATGNLSNPSINSGSVTISCNGKNIVCAVTEHTPF